MAEAAFLVCESAASASRPVRDVSRPRGSPRAKREQILDLIARRIRTRKPAAYLVNKIYMRGLPFYVDERAIVPRSFIGELLDLHFGGDDAGSGGSLIDDPAAVSSVLDLCTGSGCLAILAAVRFPNAAVDAVDISKDALEVAARNVADYGLERPHDAASRRPVRAARRQALRSDPRQSALCRRRTAWRRCRRECRAEPKLAFDGGADGLDIVRRILDEAGRHLTPEGGLLCEIGRGRRRSRRPIRRRRFLWLDTEESDGEVFWVDAASL